MGDNLKRFIIRKSEPTSKFLLEVVVINRRVEQGIVIPDRTTGIREQFTYLNHECSRQQVPSHFAFEKDQMSVTFGFFRPLLVHNTQRAAPPLGPLLSSFEGSSCTVEKVPHQTGHLNQSIVAKM